MDEGLIFDLKRFALHDGPGIRLTVFFKGCPLRCWWCHNPEGLAREPQEVLCQHRIGSQVVGTGMETVGRVYTVDQLMVEVEKEILYFDDSGGGVTFSGGEPLLQLPFLGSVLRECKRLEIHTAVDTSGFAPFQSFQEILDTVDLFLFDLKLLNDVQHLKYTGVSNRLILENLRRLADSGRRVVIRFPVIPGITDGEANIAALVELLQNLKTIRQISLLPFHAIAAGKYKRFGLENRMSGLGSLQPEALKPLQTSLEAQGFTVTIGG